MAVRLYPQGAAPVGAMDMAGNVWERCLNEFDHPERTGLAGARDVRRVLRGGSWHFVQLLARAAYRSHSRAGDRGNDCGLRVVCAAPRE